MRSLLFVGLLISCGGGPTRLPPKKVVPLPPPQGCTASNCEGCCLDGVCIRSPTNDLCGGGGQACFSCAANEVCGAARFCEPFVSAPAVEAAACPLVLVPVALSTQRALTAVWSSPSATWAVGPDGAMVLEDGALTLPRNDTAIGPGLRAVWSGTEQAQTVSIIRQGTTAAIHRETQGLGLDEPSPLQGEVFAIWGRSDADVYVGGAADEGEGEIAQWNGFTWRVTRRTTTPVIALAGYAKHSAFVATETELLMEQNGAFVSLGATPARLGGGIAVTGEREVWGAGDDGVLYHWFDGTWLATKVSSHPLTGLWPQTRKAVFVPNPSGGLSLYDGNSIIPVPVGAKLSAMHGSSDHAFAVGELGGMLARCALPGEIPDGHSIGGPTSTGGGSSGGGGYHGCSRSCVVWGSGGCMLEVQLCY